MQPTPQQLLDAVGPSAIAIDLEGRVVHWNRGATALYGWTAEEALGRPVLEVVPPEDEHEAAAILAELRAGRIWQGEFVVRDRHGRRLPVLVSDGPIRDEAGALVGVLGISFDLTGVKEVERRLGASEARFRAVLEGSSLGIVLGDLGELRPLMVNPAFCQMLGYTEKELLEQFPVAFTHPDDWPLEEALTAEIRAGLRRSYTLEKRFRTRDGGWLWANVEVARVDDPTSPRLLLVTMVTDISARRRAVEALRDREAELAALIAGAPLAVVTVDEDLRVLRWSAAAEKLFGWRAEEVLGGPYPLRPDDGPGAASFERNLEKVRGEGVVTAESVRRRKDGSLVEVAVFGSRIRLEGRQIYNAFYVDISERNRIGAQLRESEERYRLLIENSPEPIVVHRDGVYVYANPAAAAALGVERPEDLYGRCSEEFAAPELREKIRASLAEVAASNTLTPRRRTDVWVRSDGLRIHFDSTSFPILWRGSPARQVLLRDVTAREQARTELERSREELRLLARRLQEVREEEQGRLAREIHDELGQALTGMALELSWLGQRLGRPGALPRAELRERVGELARNVDSMLQVVRTLALELHPVVLDLGLEPAVRWAVDSFEARTGVTCELAAENLDGIEPECATAAYRIVQEALVNVARHARATKVRVTVRGHHGRVDVEVSDDGKGFDPGGAMRGLGLVAMRERAHACAGSLEVYSAPGKGTTVRAGLEAREEGGR